jgi:hypothetical protein
MKTSSKSILFVCAFLLCVTASAQLKADIGVRVATSDLNRLQLEFRKPLGEKYTFRLGATYGTIAYYPWTSVSDANDSVVTTRIRQQNNSSYELRFGFERKLKWKYLSVHADLATGYFQAYKYSWNAYSVLDTNNNWSDPWFTPGYENLDSQFSFARDHFVTAGLVFGISADYPLNNRLVLNLNANYGAFTRFQVGHDEINDFADEYYDGNSMTYHLYPSAGIGLRYVFGQKAEG